MKTEELRDKITTSVIKLMEENGADWVTPWAGAATGLPHNISSKNHYNGINVLLLLAAERTTGDWGTYKQWQEKGGQVRKGESGTHIVFYKSLKVKDKETQEEKKIPMMRNFTVFNADQVDGIEIDTPTEGAGETFHQGALDAMIEDTSAIIRHGGAKAYFAPSDDSIQMPLMEAFTGTDTSTPEEAYYSTLCHEMVHWTGHSSRLDRLKNGKHGGRDYAYEELIAELGAAFLGVEYGISSGPRADHAKYLNSWLKALKNDNRLIFKAAAAASRAVDHMRGYQLEAVKAA
jgi:antirestriction protein ArdC